MDRCIWIGVILLLVVGLAPCGYAMITPSVENGTLHTNPNENVNISDDTGTTDTTSASQSNTDYTTYEGKFFTVDYPSNWIRIDGLTYMGSNKMELQSDTGLMTAVIPDFQMFAPLSATDMVAVAAYDFQNVGVTLPFNREITDLMIQGSVTYQNANGEYNFLREISINGLDGYEYAISNKGMKGRADIFSKDSKYYLIYYLGNNPDGSSQYYNQILQSFSIEGTTPVELEPAKHPIPNTSHVTVNPTPKPVTTSTNLNPSLPTTGTRLSGGFFPTGDAYLTVKNSLNEHALFIITKAGTKTPIVSYFIRKGNSYTIPDIPSGSYNFYYELGTEWDDSAKAFIDGSPAMFADGSGTSPKPVTYDSQTAGYEVTLYGVSGGTANTRTLDRSSFPKL